MTSPTPPTRTFVTGASGYLGRAIVPALVAAGHDVTALSRSPEGDAAVRALGAIPTRGDLRDTDALRALATGHDALVHLGFDHGEDGAAIDVAATRALLAAAAAGPKPTRVVYTSGVFVLGPTGRPADEAAPTDRPLALVAHRAALEREVLASRSDRVLPAVVRPGIVYGGRESILEILYGSAEREGAALVIGDGTNRWSLVHREDLARLYALLLASDATGVFHAVDGAPLLQREIARLASAHVGRNGAVKPVPLDAARRQLGALADALVVEQQVVAPRSERVLGWRPMRKGFPDGA